MVVEQKKSKNIENKREEEKKQEIISKIQNPFYVNQEEISKLLDEYIQGKDNVAQKIGFLVEVFKKLKANEEKINFNFLIKKVEDLIIGQINYLSKKETNFDVDQKIQILSSLLLFSFSEKLSNEILNALEDQQQYKMTHTSLWSEFIDWVKQNGLTIGIIALSIFSRKNLLGKSKKFRQELKLPKEVLSSNLLKQLLNSDKIIIDTNFLIKLYNERGIYNSFKSLEWLVQSGKKLILPRACLDEFINYVKRSKMSFTFAKNQIGEIYRLSEEGFIVISNNPSSLTTKEMEILKEELSKVNYGNVRLGNGDIEILMLIKNSALKGDKSVVVITSDSDIINLAEIVKKIWGIKISCY